MGVAINDNAAKMTGEEIINTFRNGAASDSLSSQDSAISTPPPPPTG